jgi:repressor LexA
MFLICSMKFPACRGDILRITAAAVDGIEQRAALAAAIEARRETLSGLSKMLGRNAAWLQQYLKRGTPRLLPEEDRRQLAIYLGVSDESLGGPAMPYLIPRLDIAASAGPGRRVESERAGEGEPILPETLKRMGARAEDCGWLRVEGDSMAPLLEPGDRILVDRGRTRPDAKHLWVVRTDGELRVKRLRGDGRYLRLLSDNREFPEERRPASEVEVVGRVLRVMRDL